MSDIADTYIKKLEKDLKNLKEQVASQSSMFEMTSLYLKKTQEDLKVSEQQLFHANKDLVDSINYAKYIQDAFIVQEDSLRKIIPQSFIFQRPKDIVSGDFAWAFKNDTDIYFAIGDCTGHGVPGAMLSVFVISMLNQAINTKNTHTPASIIIDLDELVQKYLTLYNQEFKDSAELAILKYDTKNQKLLYSAAKRPLVHIHNGITTIYKGANYILGNTDRRDEIVQDREIDIQKNDMLYLFSDGFTDQFGGDKDKKFTIKNLLTLLEQTAKLPIEQQHDKMADEFMKWKGANNQTDDILLAGIRII
ncbi:MAG: PP2C family protein-serine/threonine phosphatase [Bacteroidia bacterium]